MCKYSFLIFFLISFNSAIQIPLHKGQRCMIIQSQYQPIKLQVKFPTIPNKLQNQKFKISLMDFETSTLSFEVLVDQNTLYRKNMELQENKLYHICMEVWTTRSGFNQNTEQIYAQYTADQDFDALIGTIEVPEELKGQKNLQLIYNTSTSISRISKKISEHQLKQRAVQNNLASESYQKNERIVTLTIIECLVILLSGVYQVFALRRFLIEKNLY